MIKIDPQRYAGQRAFWIKVGMAYVVERTGQINLNLTTLPIHQQDWDGTIALFPNDREETDADDEDSESDGPDRRRG